MRTRFIIVSIIAVLVVFTSSGAFAVKPPQPPEGDTVLSADIKEADGTTGQDTNSGSGVKTDHLQNEAVTTPKIADGAVTNEKIQGKISADKLETPANIIVVAKSGGDYTSITEAMNAISPSESDPYVIKIAPGTYTDAANGGNETFPIILKPYVSLIGSGANNTKIYYSNSAVPAEVFVGDSDGVLIDGLTSESAYGPGLYLFSSTGKDITLRNSTFHGHYSYAAYVENNNSVNVNNCEFTGTEGLGVTIWNLDEPATIIITNSRFIQHGVYTSDCGLDLIGGNGNVVLSGNFFRGFGHSINTYGAQGLTYITINDVDADRSFLLDDNTLYSVLVTNSRIGVSYEGVSIYTYNNFENIIKVATTMIEGTFPPSIKLFQCFDGNLDPITNP